MAYDEELAERVREALSRAEGVTERKMFGGLAFMVGGHMCCGILGEELMARVGKEAHDEALARPHTREMDFTSRPMAGMVMVEPAGIASDDDLEAWVDRALGFVRTLPPK